MKKSSSLFWSGLVALMVTQNLLAETTAKHADDRAAGTVATSCPPADPLAGKAIGAFLSDPAVKAALEAKGQPFQPLSTHDQPTAVLLDSLSYYGRPNHVFEKSYLVITRKSTTVAESTNENPVRAKVSLRQNVDTREWSVKQVQYLPELKYTTERLLKAMAKERSLSEAQLVEKLIQDEYVRQSERK